jgi:hypothetical protein
MTGRHRPTSSRPLQPLSPQTIMGLGKLSATAVAYKSAAAATTRSGHDSLSSSFSSMEGPTRLLLNEPSGSNYGAMHRTSSPEIARWPRVEHGSLMVPDVDELDVAELLEDHGLFVGVFVALTYPFCRS